MRRHTQTSFEALRVLHRPARPDHARIAYPNVLSEDNRRSLHEEPARPYRPRDRRLRGARHPHRPPPRARGHERGGLWPARGRARRGCRRAQHTWREGRGRARRPFEPDATDSLVEGVETASGPIDLLVNNAGMESVGAFTCYTREELAVDRGCEPDGTATTHASSRARACSSAGAGMSSSSPR